MSSPHNLIQRYHRTCGHIVAVSEPSPFPPPRPLVHNSISPPLHPLICPDCMRSKITAVASEHSENLFFLSSFVGLYDGEFSEIDKKEEGKEVKSEEWAQANWERMSASADVAKEMVRVMLEVEGLKVGMGYDPGWEGRRGSH
ncbi:MAG: hypothetical protein M1836_003883 [Candelina mexicana]|nr:MAG: hypothetical protein M1836_003883 [Candelina mexicana]